MSLEEALERCRGISEKDRKKLAEDLLEIILSTPNSDLIPDDLGFRILDRFKVDRLYDVEGLEALLKAVKHAEPVKFMKLLEGLLR